MIDNTINDDKTIAASGKDVILAGRYHILRQLGQGGMGSVWLAGDRQLDNRKVAIKMLPSIIVTDKRAYNQLKGEALVSLKLIHPNIVTLRAFEENNGAPFLVMDYIEGQSLSDYLAEKGKLSEAETIKLLKPIAAALDYAHGEKVIHRDVKPSNIIIRKDGHPFILDFGIAREIQESMTRMSGRTISGTLLYMSPEQLRGAPPAPAQDVYSFAAMVYECLTGNPPFTRGEIAYQILNESPKPLSSEFSIAIPIMKGLSKRPEDRVESCSDLLGECSKPERSLHDKDTIFPKGRSNKHATIYLILASLICGGTLVFLYNNHVKQQFEEPTSTSIDKDTVNSGQYNGCSNLVVQVGQDVVKQQLSEESTNNVSHAEIKVSDTVLCPKHEEKTENRQCDLSPSVKGGTTPVKFDNEATVTDKVEEVKNEQVPLDAVERTKVILSEIESGIAQYKASTHTLPSSLRELQIHMGSGIVPHLVDAWGTDIYYETDGIDYALQSAGPDRSFDIEKDNITRIVSCSIKEQDGTSSVDTAKQHKTENIPQKGTSFSVQSMASVMKWCPAGTFLMGSPLSEEGRYGAEEQHSVTITNGFWMAETEVTQAQWKRVMSGETVVDLARKGLNDNKLYWIGGKMQSLRDFWRRKSTDDPRACCGDISDDIPIYHVNWEDAVRFCRLLTKRESALGTLPQGYEYRLPTEVEWEYACRAGSSSALPNGKDLHILDDKNAPALDEIAWYGGNSSVNFKGKGYDTSGWKGKQYPGGKAFVRIVKQKKPNAWGLYDMIGNVCEWCEDWFKYTINDTVNPLEGSEEGYRVIRGGGWRDDANMCRSASRRCFFVPELRYDCIGFRVVLAPILANISQSEIGGGTDVVPILKNADEKQPSISKRRLGLLESVQSIVGFEFGKPYNLFNISGVEEKTESTISYRHELQPTNVIIFVGTKRIRNAVVNFDMGLQTISSISFVSQEYDRTQACEIIKLCREKLKQYDIDDSKWPTLPANIDNAFIKFGDMKLKEGINMMFYSTADKNKFIFFLDVIDMKVLKSVCKGSGFVPESKLPPLTSLFNMPFGGIVTNFINQPIPQEGPPGVTYYTFIPKLSFFDSDYYVCATRHDDNRIFGIACMKSISKEDTCLLIPRMVATLEEKYKRKFARCPNKKNFWEMCFYENRKSDQKYYVANKFIRLSMEETPEGKMLVTITAVDENLNPSVSAIDPLSIKAL